MKKLILISLIILEGIPSFAQESISGEPIAPKVYKNEFGIDVTGFIKQFLNFNQNTEYYNPNYYLTYRRHYKKGNFRFALRGNYFSEEITLLNTTDYNKNKNNGIYFGFRIGYEFTNNINKRWQVFYGIDLKPSFRNTRNDAFGFDGGYIIGNKNQSYDIGLGPLLGFRYRLNKRISITTETSFSFFWHHELGKRYFTPVNNQYPAVPDVDIPKTTDVKTTFEQPLSLIFTFDI